MSCFNNFFNNISNTFEQARLLGKRFNYHYSETLLASKIVNDNKLNYSEICIKRTPMGPSLVCA